MKNGQDINWNEALCILEHPYSNIFEWQSGWMSKIRIFVNCSSTAFPSHDILCNHWHFLDSVVMADMRLPGIHMQNWSKSYLQCAPLPVPGPWGWCPTSVSPTRTCGAPSAWSCGRSANPQSPGSPSARAPGSQVNWVAKIFQRAQGGLSGWQKLT